jgi:hypothetical protein
MAVPLDTVPLEFSIDTFLIKHITVTPSSITQQNNICGIMINKREISLAFKEERYLVRQ